MWFWLFMFVWDLFIPILMISFGRIMWKYPTKKINGIKGYRTTLSMKNMDTLRFSQDYCGRLWWKVGCIMLIPSILVHFLIYNSSETSIGVVSIILCVIQCIILIITGFNTERALKRTFTNEGIRK